MLISLQKIAQAVLTLPYRLFSVKTGWNCLIVNGRYPERVVQAVYGKPVYGTAVKGNI